MFQPLVRISWLSLPDRAFIGPKLKCCATPGVAGPEVAINCASTLITRRVADTYCQCVAIFKGLPVKCSPGGYLLKSIQHLSSERKRWSEMFWFLAFRRYAAEVRFKACQRDQSFEELLQLAALTLTTRMSNIQTNMKL